jgi:hypothetical protein
MWESFRVAPGKDKPFQTCIELWDKLEQTRRERMIAPSSSSSSANKKRKTPSCSSPSSVVDAVHDSEASFASFEHQRGLPFSINTYWPHWSVPRSLLPPSFLFSHAYPHNSNDPDFNRKQWREMMLSATPLLTDVDGTVPALSSSSQCSIEDDWSSIGGLGQHIDQLRQAVVLPLLYPV